MLRFFSLSPRYPAPSIRFNLFRNPYSLRRPSPGKTSPEYEADNVLTAGPGLTATLLNKNPGQPDFAPPDTFVFINPGDLDFKTPELYGRGTDLNGRSLLVVIEAAGIGDTVKFLPYLKKVKAAYPESAIWVSIHQFKHCVFYGQEWLDRLLPYPCFGSEIRGIEFCFFPGTILDERSFGLCPDSLTPQLFPEPSKKAEAEIIFNKIRSATGKPVVFLHWHTSSAARNIPGPVVRGIVERKKDWIFVACLPSPEFSAADPWSGLRDLPILDLADPQRNDPGFLMAALSQADGVISADTSAVHLAGGLGKKVVMIQTQDYDLAGWPENMDRIYPESVRVKGFENNGTDLVDETIRQAQRLFGF